MLRNTALAALCSAILTPNLHAAVLGSQDFNALDDSGTFTTDSLAGPSSPLTNSGSFNIAGPGLDFGTFFTDTRGGSGPLFGSESGDFIGVNSFAGGGAPDTAADGTPVTSGSEHNFQFNDGDGLLELVFEPLDLSGYTSRVLSLDYWIADTGYESDDFFFVALDDGSTAVELLGAGEPELEGSLSADGDPSFWEFLLVDLDTLILTEGLDDSSLSLIIGVDTNSGAENIFVDNVLITGAPVPVPAAVWLLGSALAGFVSVGRRKN